MQASTVCTPIGGDDDTIYVAIELSQKGWLIVLHSPAQKGLARHKLEAGGCEALLSLLATKQAQVERMTGRRPSVVSCYEAGYDGFWLHRRLAAAGIENLVIDPASLSVERRARRAKTDRIDGEKMLRALLAYRRGEPRVMSAVRVPTVAQEDARRRSRERERLIKEQTGHVNRIRGLLRTMGLPAGEPGRADWPRKWLAQQVDWQGQALPALLVAELGREHARLMMVRGQLAELGEEALPQEAAAKARQLMRLKGLGPVSATTLVSEVFWKDFKNRREVGSYLGLTPSPWQSGAVAYDQGISKAGNRRARHVTLELTWLWLHNQPQSALSRWFRERVGEQHGRIRRIAIVALARKLVIALWRFLTLGIVPDDAVLKA